MNHRFDALESVIVDVQILDLTANTWQHAQQILDVSHLFDLLQLGQEIFKIEFILGDFLRQSLGFFFVERHLRTLNQRNHITHTQDPTGHTIGIEDIQCLHLFAHAHKLDGLVYHRLDAQRRTTAGITV